MRLQDKVAIVTGAASGLVRVLPAVLLRRGLMWVLLISIWIMPTRLVRR